MASIEMTVAVNTVPRLFDEARTLLGAMRVHKSVEQAGVELTRRHIYRVANERDRGSRFYSSFADATFGESNSEMAQVHIPATRNKQAGVQRGNPFAAHLFGATIVPSGETSQVTGRPIRRLAIPATEEARHLSPGDFTSLRVMRLGGALALVMASPEERAALGKRRIKSLQKKDATARRFGGLVIMFWLVKRAVIPADRSILPSEPEYASAATTAVWDLMDRVRYGRGGRQ